MRSAMVCVDFSDITDCVLEQSIRLARGLNCSIHLLHVMHGENFVMYSPGGFGSVVPAGAIALERDLQTETARLQALANEVQRYEVHAEMSVREGKAITEILAEAERIEPDIIVMGSHGHGALYELLVGSVTDGVLRQARMPVMVVPARK